VRTRRIRPQPPLPKSVLLHARPLRSLRRAPPRKRVAVDEESMDEE